MVLMEKDSFINLIECFIGLVALSKINNKKYLNSYHSDNTSDSYPIVG